MIAKELFIQKVLCRCEGVYQSSYTIEGIFDAIAEPVSRDLYKSLIGMLDQNIEYLAVLTDLLQERGIRDYDVKELHRAMTKAKTKSWQVLEHICAFYKRRFKEDAWHDRNTFPKIPRPSLVKP